MRYYTCFSRLFNSASKAIRTLTYPDKIPSSKLKCGFWIKSAKSCGLRMSSSVNDGLIRLAISSTLLLWNRIISSKSRKIFCRSNPTKVVSLIQDSSQHSRTIDPHRANHVETGPGDLPARIVVRQIVGKVFHMFGD